MSDISSDLRRLVLQRAGQRCEYCGLAQEGQEASFHIDHVVPRAMGGHTNAENLALACVSCSLRKGARQTAVDPEFQQKAPLYNPRCDIWADHFRWEGVHLIGQTATARATIAALRMNRPLILEIRVEESARNRHPPPAGE